jgi:hypothetical protein
MAISLYDLTVPTYLQTLTGVSGVLDRGLSHCVDNNVDPADIVATRLFADMAPFSFQLWSVVHHSRNALEGLKSGVFGPPAKLPELDYAGWQQLILDTRQALQAVSADEVNSLEGRPVEFQMGQFKVPFTAENFVLSFSLPNFHFHATTTYDILRMKGVPLGKRDYMGPLRMKV